MDMEIKLVSSKKTVPVAGVLKGEVDLRPYMQGQCGTVSVNSGFEHTINLVDIPNNLTGYGPSAPHLPTTYFEALTRIIQTRVARNDDILEAKSNYF